MSTGYSFALTCPSCGRELVHRDSEPLDPDHCRAEAWCQDCRTIWRIDVVATAIQRTRCGDSDEERRNRASFACYGPADPRGGL